MPTVAYIANQFPSPVEPYIVEEIRELQKRGVEVVMCSGRRAEIMALSPDLLGLAADTVCLQPLRSWLLLRAGWLCLLKFSLLTDLLQRMFLRGTEPPLRRVRALLHTGIGAYYALVLKGRGVEHIHAHHGYFASWVAMVAARLLRIDFSMTLHGSDLLLHGAYLDTKLAHCSFCFTVSEYNRRYILDHYPMIDPGKIILQRIGVDPLRGVAPLIHRRASGGCLVLLAVGRLHRVKDHAFLVQACALLKANGVSFLCLIVGDGPERKSLEQLIIDFGLPSEVKLLGYVPRERLDSYYAISDLVVLTSRSEGIPLVLMEAMAHGKTVLAPAITGIPELVLHGETGFLYRPGSLEDFVAQVEFIRGADARLQRLQHTARQYVLAYFNRNKNLELFGDLFLEKIAAHLEGACRENLVLQQI